MLILKRNVGERICIGEDVVIEITEVKGSKVSVGVTAPKTVSVDREEVLYLKQQEAK